MKRTILLFIVAATLFARSLGNSIVDTGEIKDTSRLAIFSDSSTAITQYAVASDKSVQESNASFTKQKSKRKNKKAPKKVYIQSKKINPDYLEGIDIVAFGADPSWSLDINHNKAIQFSIPGLEAPIAFSAIPPVLSGDSIIYNIVSANDKMLIILSPGICSDGVGDNVYDYKVTVNYKNKTYNGCGAVMNADGSLTGTWLLKNAEGVNNTWKTQPYIIVDLEAEKFYGNTGCNNFSGSARLRGSRICFSDIKFESQKECNGYEETKLIEALIKCNGYAINDCKLEMLQNGKALLSLKRQLEDYL
jgi:uncharacterized membrane protein/heat shock protein HslJ